MDSLPEPPRHVIRRQYLELRTRDRERKLLKKIEQSIQRLYTLPDDYIIFCGHGPATSIGHEKKHNPFFKG